MALFPASSTWGGVKSQTFSGNTDSDGNFNLGTFSSTGVIVGVREIHNYLCINTVTNGGNNYVKVVDFTGTSYTPKVSTAVSGTFYYIDYFNS